jgi:hypothetical protein
MEEVVHAFNHVIEIKGWAMYWGTSEWSADEIAEACGIAKQLGLVGPIVEQPFYNLLSRKKVEGEFQRLYSRFGLGLTTSSPLKFGLLSGKYSGSPDAPPPGSRFAKGEDKFVNYMRDNYGNSAWQDDISKVQKLKVCVSSCRSFSLPVSPLFLFLQGCRGQDWHPAIGTRARVVLEEPQRVVCHYGRLETGADCRERQGSQVTRPLDTGDYEGD